MYKNVIKNFVLNCLIKENQAVRGEKEDKADFQCC